MIRTTAIRIGQQDEPLYTIDRAFAKAVLEAISVLRSETDIPDEWRGEECWLDLRIRRWKALADLNTRLSEFVKGVAQELQIGVDEETLIGELMVCVTTLLEKAEEKEAVTLETTATIIGIVGGAIAIAAAIGFS